MKLSPVVSRILSALLSALIVLAVFGAGRVSAWERAAPAPPSAPGGEMVRPQSGFQPAGESFSTAWQASPPAPSSEHLAALADAQARTHPLPPPAGPSPAAPEAPDPATQSLVQDLPAATSDQTAAPGSPTVMAAALITLTAQAGMTITNNLSPSVAQAGKVILFTGNHFFARSVNGGRTWQFTDPAADFSSNCCGQRVLYDSARNLWIWLRQGMVDANGRNIFRVSLSRDAGASWCGYNFATNSINAGWTNQYFNYLEVQAGSQYLAITSDIHNPNGSWARSIMLRLPLDSLMTCAGFTYNYFWQVNWFHFVTLQGSPHAFYFASNWPIAAPYNQMMIVRWDETGGTAQTVAKTVTDWSRSGYGCGNGQRTWLTNSNQRILTGARYLMHGSAGPIGTGRWVIAWWWNAAKGGSFPQDYIDGAAFYEDTLTQVDGLAGRPLVWNGTACFAYPAAAASSRQNIAMVFNYGEATTEFAPRTVFTMADDYNVVPPQWVFYAGAISYAFPADHLWGDWNTLVPLEPSGKVWVAGTAGIFNFTDCAGCALPFYFVFGRYRDLPSYSAWATSPPTTAAIPLVRK